MEFIVICLTAFGASLLTFFSGFGLGTILTPVMIIFFPLHEAIALTGIVHLLNNVFKLYLVGNQTNKSVALRFGIPAIVGSFIGAYVLIHLSQNLHHYYYTLGGKTMDVTFLKLVIAALMIVFALFEIVPKLKSINFDKKYLIPGGLLSGFFGGLSGNQGALRSVFLLRYGLTKEVYIATGVVIASLIDVTRLSMYFSSYSHINYGNNIKLLMAAALCAFAGAFLGNKLLKKITLQFVQIVASIMIIVLALLLGFGIL